MPACCGPRRMLASVNVPNWRRRRPQHAGGSADGVPRSLRRYLATRVDSCVPQHPGAGKVAMHRVECGEHRGMRTEGMRRLPVDTLKKGVVAGAGRLGRKRCAAGLAHEASAVLDDHSVHAQDPGEPRHRRGLAADAESGASGSTRRSEGVSRWANGCWKACIASLPSTSRS